MKVYTALTVITAVLYASMLVADLRIGGMYEHDINAYTVAANIALIVWIIASVARALGGWDES